MYSLALAIRNVVGLLTFALLLLMLLEGRYASAGWMLTSVWAGMVAGDMVGDLIARDDGVLWGKLAALVVLAAPCAALAVYLSGKVGPINVLGLPLDPTAITLLVSLIEMLARITQKRWRRAMSERA
jgi:hypothetical protein